MIQNNTRARDETPTRALAKDAPCLPPYLSLPATPSSPSPDQSRPSAVGGACTAADSRRVEAVSGASAAFESAVTDDRCRTVVRCVGAAGDADENDCG